MRSFYIIALTSVLLGACDDPVETVDVVELETYEDRLSYTLGAMNAEALMSSPDPNVSRLDLEKVISGFENNYNDGSIEDCKATFEKFYGPYYTDFDTTYLKEGSECRGREIAYVLYSDMVTFDRLKDIKKDKLLAGFKDGLYDRDTLISDMDQRQLINEFYTGIMADASSKMFEEARKKENIREIDGGIIIETIKEGTGGSPTDQDDVKVDYILTNFMGDTVQSSFDFREDKNNISESPAFNLQGVFPGWTKAFPELKKGGIYRLYLPFEMVQHPDFQGQSVCFYVEFYDYGPAFTLAERPPGM